MNKKTICSLASSSSANAYLLTDRNGSQLLVEAGLNYRQLQKKLNFSTARLVGCLVSHEHQDHARAVPKLMSAGVDVWMSRGTADAMRTHRHHRCRITFPGVFENIGSWRVLPFQTIHDAKEPLGFLLSDGESKILFATDTAYIGPRFCGLTHIMIECNYDTVTLRKNVESGDISLALRDRLFYSHFELEAVLDFLRFTDQSQLCEVWLLHCSEDNLDYEKMLTSVRSVVKCPVFIAVDEV